MTRPSRTWHWVVDAALRAIVARGRRGEAKGDLEELWRWRRGNGRRDLWRATARDLAGMMAAGRGRGLRRGGIAMGQDLTFVWRSWRRRPVVAIATICTLALGMGAGAAVFAATERTLWRPLPFVEPDRLVHVENGPTRLAGAGSFILKSFSDLPEIQNAGVWASGGINLDGDVASTRFSAAAVDAGFFATLGVAPYLGDPLPSTDTRERFAVLAYDTWRSRFGEDRAVIGTRPGGRACSKTPGPQCRAGRSRNPRGTEPPWYW